jgi:N6-adenosine-specific RNA methylase IME4
MKLDVDTLRKLPLELRIEIEENAQRKPLTQSELAAEQRTILAVLRKFKTPGQRTDLNGGTATSEKVFSEVRATAIVGRLYGESHKQVERRQAVVDAAEAEPERFGKFLVDMDRTDRVNGVYRRLKIARQAELIRAEPPPFPGNGPYRVVVIDPPWENQNRAGDPSRRGIVPYPTKTVAEICALPIASILHTDCVLWFWTTNFYMREAYTAIDAYGLASKTILTWVKPRHCGLGDWLLGQTEHCILAVRGKPIVQLTDQSTVLFAPVRGHSAKPPEFYDLVESLCPAPRYADFFSRYRHNDRWDCHGDEAPKVDEEAPT